MYTYYTTISCICYLSPTPSLSPPFSPPSPVLPLYLPSLLPSLPCSSSLSPLPSQYVTSRMHCSVGQAWASSGGCLITGLEYGTITAERISARLWMRDLFLQCTCVRTYVSITLRNVIDCFEWGIYSRNVRAYMGTYVHVCHAQECHRLRPIR